MQFYKKNPKFYLISSYKCKILETSPTSPIYFSFQCPMKAWEGGGEYFHCFTFWGIRLIDRWLSHTIRRRHHFCTVQYSSSPDPKSRGETKFPQSLFFHCLKKKGFLNIDHCTGSSQTFLKIFSRFLSIRDKMNPLSVQNLLISDNSHGMSAWKKAFMLHKIWGWGREADTFSPLLGDN